VLRLGIYALPFGYGPASNAVTVAETLHSRHALDIDWTFVSSGIGLELLARSRIPATVLDTGGVDVDPVLAARLAGSLDGMIVLMHRSWADRLAPDLPVFFITALGYMCQPDAFTGFPGLRQLKRYYVQDIFGAHQRVMATGLAHVMPVAPIVDLAQADYDMAGARAVFHLGGVLNPFPAGAAPAYPAGVAELIRVLGGPDALVLTSAGARERFAAALDGLRVESLSHQQAISAYRQAGAVYTSPGLTCLLELARLGRPVTPLPPENYSQLVNLRLIVAHFGASLPEVWHFLARAYADVGAEIPERLGVEQVAERNSQLLPSARFRREYLAAARSAPPGELQLGRRDGPSGAVAIAADVEGYYAEHTRRSA
jgi:hypothetical protein